MNQYRTDKHLPRLAQLAKAYPHRALGVQVTLSAECSVSTNPTTGEVEAVFAISEISNRLAGKICRGLSVPEAGRS
jgi:hypothetical protein